MGYKFKNRAFNSVEKSKEETKNISGTADLSKNKTSNTFFIKFRLLILNLR